MFRQHYILLCNLHDLTSTLYIFKALNYKELNLYVFKENDLILHTNLNPHFKHLFKI